MYRTYLVGVLQVESESDSCARSMSFRTPIHVDNGNRDKNTSMMMCNNTIHRRSIIMIMNGGAVVVC